MRTLFCLFLVICLAVETPCFADDDAERAQIRQWIQQLGDNSFLVRQRAETLLIRAGIQACVELQRAQQSHDVEIVRRTEYILSQIEQAFRDMEHQDSAVWIVNFQSAPDLASKAKFIWRLADPVSIPRIERNFEKGEGLQTLCRLARFEKNNTLRRETVKSLIASPPISPPLRQKWYRHIRDIFHEVGDDELLQCLVNYAKLWCDMDDADTKTTPAFQERVRQVGAETMRLLEKLEGGIPSGSRMDILLYYAVAELQDAAGLSEDRDKTVASALAVQQKQMPEPTLIELLDIDAELPMFEHWYVGYLLRQRFRLHWAMARCQKVIENGHFLLCFQASNEAAQIAIFLADYASAAAYWDKYMEIIDSPEYKKLRGNSAEQMIMAQKQKAYCLAMKAAAEENWTQVRETIMQAWAIPDAEIDISDMDMVILAHRFCKQQSEEDREFRDKTDQALKQMWQTVVDYHEMENNVPSTCNSAAWLLANTDGDYQTALTFAETAVKAEPDNESYLDTLAHVYFLGGKIDEAIHTQEKVIRMAPEAVVFRQAFERFKRAKESP